MNYELSHNIFSKKLSHNKKFNQSQELYNDPVKSKIANKKFSPSDHFHKTYNTSSNYYNSNFNIYKEKGELHTGVSEDDRPAPWADTDTGPGGGDEVQTGCECRRA